MWCVFVIYPKEKYICNYLFYTKNFVYTFFCTNTSPLEYSKIGGFCMCEKVNFNVIEKNKNSNIEDIEKFINNIVNKLIVNEFVNSIEQ